MELQTKSVLTRRTERALSCHGATLPRARVSLTARDGQGYTQGTREDAMQGSGVEIDRPVTFTRSQP